MKKALNYSNYLITEDGKVFSLIRNRYLTPAKNNVGYLQQYLTDDNGNKRWVKIHRLVAIAYIDNPDNKPEVNHLDSNKANNHKDNLQWVTHKENIIHSYQTTNRAKNCGKHLIGKEVSKETKELQSKAKQGINHPKFKGCYIYNDLKATSLNALASLINSYPVKVNRMYKKGLIKFEPK